MAPCPESVCELTFATAVKGKLPIDAVSVTACGAGVVDPAAELNISELVETVRLCADVTVSFTITACGLLPAPAETMLICPV